MIECAKGSTNNPEYLFLIEWETHTHTHQHTHTQITL